MKKKLLLFCNWSGIIEQISVVNLQQAEEIQLLKYEIARLKGLKPKPYIKPA